MYINCCTVMVCFQLPLFWQHWQNSQTRFRKTLGLKVMFQSVLKNLQSFSQEKNAHKIKCQSSYELAPAIWLGLILEMLRIISNIILVID